MKWPAPPHRTPTTPPSFNPRDRFCPNRAVCWATVRLEPPTWAGWMWTSHRPGSKYAPFRSMTWTLPPTGERPPSVISAMRPSSMTTLASGTGLGSTQSISVAFVSTRDIVASKTSTLDEAPVSQILRRRAGYHSGTAALFSRPDHRPQDQTTGLKESSSGPESTCILPYHSSMALWKRYQSLSKTVLGS